MESTNEGTNKLNFVNSDDEDSDLPPHESLENISDANIDDPDLLELEFNDKHYFSDCLVNEEP